MSKLNEELNIEHSKDYIRVNKKQDIGLFNTVVIREDKNKTVHLVVNVYKDNNGPVYELNDGNLYSEQELKRVGE